jgi:hypothetical protein
MKDDESQAQGINVVAFPADKMEKVLEALRPILGIPQFTTSVASDDEAILASDHGLQTGCTRTSASGSSDWSCSDAMV